MKHNDQTQHSFPTCFGGGLGFYSLPQQLSEDL